MNIAKTAPKELKTNNFSTKEVFIVCWDGCYITKDFDSVVFAVLFVFSDISGAAVLVQACLITQSQVLHISYFSFRSTFPTCTNTFRKPGALLDCGYQKGERNNPCGQKIHLCFCFCALTQPHVPHVNHRKARSDIPEKSDFFMEVSLLPLITEDIPQMCFSDRHSSPGCDKLPA